MSLSRSTKAIVLAASLLAVGVGGTAAAQEIGPRHYNGGSPGPAAAPAVSSASASPSGSAITGKAAADKTGTGKTAPGNGTTGNGTTGNGATSPAAGPAKKATVAKSAVKTDGPAGSHTTTGTAGVALTFDDGPDPAETPQILKLLAQQHVHATFCLVGENVERHPELVRQIVAGGHTLCNHTWNHSLTIGKKPQAQIKADLERTNAAIRKAAPGARIKYFRAPGGNFTPRLVATAKSMGMTSIYWRVDPRDWDHPAGESHSAHRARVIAVVEKNAHNGAIVLSHDYAQPDTIAAYKTLIPWLKKRHQLIALP